MLEQSESLLTFEIQRMQTTKCPLHECNKKANAQPFQFKDTKVARWTAYFLHFIQQIICWCKSHYDFIL